MNNCFKIFDVNLVEQSTITASSENLSFPSSNIKDHRRSKVFRSTSPTCNIVFDFNETSDADAVFITPHTRYGFGITTATLEFSNSSNFTSPAYSVNIPLSEKLGVGFVTFPLVSHRFARLVLTSTLSHCEVANVFIGKEMGLERSISFGWTQKDEELSVKTKNRYGQVFADIIARQKSLGFAFKNISKDDIELINTMTDRIGEIKPFYISIGNDDMVSDHRRLACGVILDDVPLITNASFNKYNLSITARELT